MEDLSDPTAELTVQALETYDMETGVQKMDLVAAGIYKKPPAACPSSGSGPNLETQPCPYSLCDLELKPPTTPIPGPRKQTTYYIEGVRPGKCTLKWELTAAGKSVAYEQTFLVATQKKKEDWHDEVVYQIRLQTKVGAINGEVDVRTFTPSRAFFANQRIIQQQNSNCCGDTLRFLAWNFQFNAADRAMVNKLILFTLSLGQSCLAGTHVLQKTRESEDAWPLHAIKFDAIGTLKNVYDAGIRPYWWPGMENFSLGFKKVRLVCSVHGRPTPIFPCLYGAITVNQRGQLVSFSATARPRTTSSAKSMLLQWLPIADKFDTSALNDICAKLEAAHGNKPDILGLTLFGSQLKVGNANGTGKTQSHSIGMTHSYNTDFPCQTHGARSKPPAILSVGSVHFAGDPQCRVALASNQATLVFHITPAFMPKINISSRLTYQLFLAIRYYLLHSMIEAKPLLTLEIEWHYQDAVFELGKAHLQISSGL